MGDIMDEKIKVLLDKINISLDNYPYFMDAKIEKIVVNSKGDKWNFYISKDYLLPDFVFKELEISLIKLLIYVPLLTRHFILKIVLLFLYLMLFTNSKL